MEEQNHLSDIGRVPYEKHLCEIILNLGLQFRNRCHLKTFLSLAAFVWRRETIWAISIGDSMRNIC